MYSTEALVLEHKRQMRELRRELKEATRNRRAEARRMNGVLAECRKQWVVERPKPKRTPLPLRVLSFLF
ncbi:hypothetical protein [Desulfocurvus sp.]|jgi:hypothetical protein|uniref:hypothetical protein n=1 Tax=Desulfocurvus sp. TaxID=2871698 RepID=UPI0025BC22F9|nr:hypothetical protein [Desulfocurvus sp.]MCK9239390.1 hypothetical protein [Desulfocurvus sp.]